MTSTNKNKSQELTEHFFRNEYGRMVSVMTRYMGANHVQTAEDIVQETLLKAVHHWQHHGIPKNPQAWLYVTAKNLVLNIVRRKKHQIEFQNIAAKIEEDDPELETLLISEEQVSDEQLKMMFVCCHPSISEKSQLALILKTLCGFSISEIAHAFFTSKEIINKRLVRGRKQLRTHQVNFELPKNLDARLPIVLKAIFLLFNEGYSPTTKNELIRYDLCLEAIRLCELLVNSETTTVKSDCHALLALMYCNAARFESRMNLTNSIVEMDKQDRKKWDQKLINKGIHLLNLATAEINVSTYLILATISAQHCIAPSFAQTDWKEILSLYDALLELEDTPIARLNRSVALAQVKGNKEAILELEDLTKRKGVQQNHLLHATLAEFYASEHELVKAKKSYTTAISLSQNERDIELLQKKLAEVVPI